jgi:putative transposase
MPSSTSTLTGRLRQLFARGLTQDVLFSHLKGDWPHLVEIRDPAALDAELARIRTEYNTVRLHASIGYVTPDDEHHGRGPQIRRARAAGMRRARAERIKHNRANKT